MDTLLSFARKLVPVQNRKMIQAVKPGEKRNETGRNEEKRKEFTEQDNRKEEKDFMSLLTCLDL